MDLIPRHARILIIGTGVAGLRTAKTLLDDGFMHIHLISESLSAGGIWAADDKGTNYPGLLTNSGIGDYEYSTFPLVEDPDLLKNNENRISGATVTRYLEEFTEKYIRGRVESIRFGQRVLLMDRTPDTSTGWSLEVQDLKSGNTSSECFDKVVLCVGTASKISIPAAFNDPAFIHSFQGLVVHSSQITSAVHDKILSLPSSAKIVVVGAGKSAVDLAQLYGQMGKDVTNIFRTSRLYAADTPNSESMVQSRMASTLSTPQHPKTRLERFLHGTKIGAFLVHMMFKKVIPSWALKLRISPDSPLAFKGYQSVLYLGPSTMGGRAMSLPNSYHGLVYDDKIKVIKGVEPTGVSSDGKGIILSDGQTLEAEVVIAATGYGYPFDFIPQPRRKQLGLELEAPYSLINRYEGLADFPVLQPVPVPPRSDPATHVYLGILPSGAVEARDIAICGGAFAIKFPFISELSSHYISSYFLSSSHLTLPATNAAAFALAEDHAEWIRARFPLTPFPWGKTLWAPWLNTDQYVEQLFEEMGLSSRRREEGWLGMGFYTGRLTPAVIKDLGEERRALRVAAGEE